MYYTFHVTKEQNIMSKFYLIIHLLLDFWKQLFSPHWWPTQISGVCITIRGYTGLDDPDHITEIQEVFPIFTV